MENGAALSEMLRSVLVSHAAAIRGSGPALSVGNLKTNLLPLQ